VSDKSIFVTQPSLPPLKEYVGLLEEIWKTGILTHNGPMVQQLERELETKLNTKWLAAVTNGTVAIQMAIKALGLKGEIITTPFSWIATISAIKWEGCTPVFCDIEPNTLNIDPAKIEALITPSTVAILPVHVFGTPCDVLAIECIAKKHNLKVIYDAAHALGSTFNGSSIFDYGDVSATSLHGTKLLNTAEGGACVANSEDVYQKLKRIRFFGHDDNKEIAEDGCNGKMSEIHAALGVANMKYFDEVLADRKVKYQIYKDVLSSSTELEFQSVIFGETNYSYFPVILENEETLLKVEQHLKEASIFPRRYFYPSLNTLTKIVDYKPTPVSENLSKRILCLPLYKALSKQEVIAIGERVLYAL
jgi:hypothetical protein